MQEFKNSLVDNIPDCTTIEGYRGLIANGSMAGLIRPDGCSGQVVHRAARSYQQRGLRHRQTVVGLSKRLAEVLLVNIRASSVMHEKATEAPD